MMFSQFQNFIFKNNVKCDILNCNDISCDNINCVTINGITGGATGPQGITGATGPQGMTGATGNPSGLILGNTVSGLTKTLLSNYDYVLNTYYTPTTITKWNEPLSIYKNDVTSQPNNTLGKYISYGFSSNAGPYGRTAYIVQPTTENVVIFNSYIPTGVYVVNIKIACITATLHANGVATNNTSTDISCVTFRFGTSTSPTIETTNNIIQSSFNASLTSSWYYYFNVNGFFVTSTNKFVLMITSYSNNPYEIVGGSGQDTSHVDFIRIG